MTTTWGVLAPAAPVAAPKGGDKKMGRVTASCCPRVGGRGAGYNDARGSCRRKPAVRAFRARSNASAAAASAAAVAPEEELPLSVQIENALLAAFPPK